MEQRRYLGGDRGLNQGLGFLVRGAGVKVSAAESDRFLATCSKLFFYAMLLCQISGATVVARWARRGSGAVMWLFAGTLGLAALAFGARADADLLTVTAGERGRPLARRERTTPVKRSAPLPSCTSTFATPRRPCSRHAPPGNRPSRPSPSPLAHLRVAFPPHPRL